MTEALSAALLELAELNHDREFWHDSNRTHIRIFADCPDEDCVRYRALALTDADLGIAASDKWPAFSD